ncbi:glycosyltransferase [Polynucleobacter sp. Nonnen-W13]|uniref:glycosyltransferase n=1 Tax=Polynucleobacter sp. Nonnen-W13 TaxID=1855625 RepID=UPI001C0B02E1|nr:glycosyltransferase [Polynucleobacter sp. Nonnen-W13]MBU3558365.1 glycosyltransferase [Polynucleobacter sp. Nonnen-W13]
MISSVKKITSKDLTVLMALYHGDKPNLFNAALNSILHNSIRPDKIILVVDGKISDSLEEIICKFKNELNIIRLDKNYGLAYALNQGLEFVDTQWVARADADDISHPNRFEVQIDYLNNYGIDILGSQIYEVDVNNKIVAVKKVPISDLEIKKYLLNRNPFNHMSVIFNIDLFKKYGGYPEVYLKEDYALWGKYISHGALCLNCTEILISAMTGKRFYKRRGGLHYIKSEFKLQMYFHSIGMKNLYSSFVCFLIRSFIFMLPSYTREYIYMHLLRDKFNRV